MNTDTGKRDRVFVLLCDMETIYHNAQHLIDNLPNVDLFAVQRSIKKLELAKKLLHDLQFNNLEPKELDALQELLDCVLLPLRDYERESREHPKFTAPRESQGH
jgi:hypothetical protein